MNNKFRIVTTVWNASQFIERCLKSVKNQIYTNWEMIIIDDLSTDNTSEIIKKFVEKEPRMKYVRNEANLGGLVNYVKYIPEFCTDGEDIICFLDGDDALYSNDVLEYLNGVYNSGEVWLTYGDFIIDGGANRGTYLPIPNMETVCSNHGVNLTHLKSLKYHLYSKIKQETFIDSRSGRIFDTVWDVVIMISAAQIAGISRIRKVDKIMYLYNNSNNNSTVRSGNTKAGGGFKHLIETNWFFRENYCKYEVIKDKYSETRYGFINNYREELKLKV